MKVKFSITCHESQSKRGGSSRECSSVTISKNNQYYVGESVSGFINTSTVHVVTYSILCIVELL